MPWESCWALVVNRSNPLTWKPVAQMRPPVGERHSQNMNEPEPSKKALKGISDAQNSEIAEARA
jgi:hypothetical protein